MVNDKNIPEEEGLIKSKEIGQEKYHVPFESILLTKIVIVNPKSLKQAESIYLNS